MILGMSQNLDNLPLDSLVEMHKRFLTMQNKIEKLQDMLWNANSRIEDVIQELEDRTARIRAEKLVYEKGQVENQEVSEGSDENLR